MKKKKIAFYYDLFFLGGVEHAILTLIKKIHNDYQIYIVYSDKKSNAGMLDRYRSYAEVVYLDDTDIDVDTCVCCARMDAELFRNNVRAKKYYAWVHAIMFQTYENFYYEDSYKKIIDKFICVSESVKEDIVSVYPELEEKCQIVMNYLDLDIIEAKALEECDLVVEDDCLNIITVARLSFEKGFHRVKALIDLFNQNNIKYHWYVLGTAYTHAVEDEIKSMFNLTDNITFLGYQDNPYKYIRKMDYLALLSDIESWGLVITEALALKIPCIVTNFKEACTQINKTNGIIIPMETDDYHEYLSNICDNRLKILNVRQIEKTNLEALFAWQQLL